MKTRALAIIASLLLLLTACGEVGTQTAADSTEAEKVKETKEKVAEKKTSVWPKSCPVTVPGKDAFIPASEAPDGPLSVYEAVWYGTPDLWTMLDPNGLVWRDLPVGADGALTQKTLWWSEHLSSESSAEITLSAEHLDGSAPTVEVSGPGGASSSPSSPSFGSFMVVGFELPQPGCWKITTEYQGATLSYIVWVDND